VQHERVSISPQFSNDEGHVLSHQARDEGHISGESVELGYNDWTLPLPACGQGCGKLRASVEGIRPLPCFDLDELGGEVKVLRRCEPLDGLALRFNAEARSALPSGGYAIVGNGLLHRDKLSGRLYKIHTTVCVLYVAKYLATFSNFAPGSHLTVGRR
jgi:hypothetical protein